ncbi:MAG: 3,4-dihydroxy-2-butanone-4-phosphate synthase [Actinobacteria bacterium]|nr:3,4-dihydroxy-2-butanone-4-phosphate synthase [Actinomycetota bacterium]
MSLPFSTVEEAVEEIRRGRMVVVCDDADRENEGDLVMAAQFATPQAINFMAKEARGLICLALTGERCDQLGLALMAGHGEAPLGTAFTETIGAADGGVGTSAQARAHTIRTAVAPDVTPADVVVPGHIPPLRARAGGSLERPGHTEAAVDLARLAGLTPAGVICEVMNGDGSMARLPDLVPYCERHGLKMITVADLIAYRRRTEKLVERVVETSLPTTFGDFRAFGYRSLLDDSHHVAMVKGELDGGDEVLVRVHAACLTGDIFHGTTCDCHARLEESMELIERRGEGVLVYLSRTGHELDALLGGPDVEGAGHDLRDYDLGGQILADLGIGRGALVRGGPAVGRVLLD